MWVYGITRPTKPRLNKGPFRSAEMGAAAFRPAFTAKDWQIEKLVSYIETFIDTPF